MQEQAGKASSLSLFTSEEITNGFQAIRKRFLEYQKYKVRNKTIYRSEEEEEEEDEETRESIQKSTKNGPIKKSGKHQISSQVISDSTGQMDMENEPRKEAQKQKDNDVAATNFQLKKRNQKMINNQQAEEQISKIAESLQTVSIKPSPSFVEVEQTFTEIPSRKNNSLAAGLTQRNKQPKIEDQQQSNYVIQNRPIKDNKNETKQEATVIVEDIKTKEKVKSEGIHQESSQCFSNTPKNPIDVQSFSKKEETEDAICKKRFLSNQTTIETQKIPLAKKSTR